MHTNIDNGRKYSLTSKETVYVCVPVYVVNALVCARARPSPCLHVARLHHNACHCAHALLLASQCEDLLHLSSALVRGEGEERWRDRGHGGEKKGGEVEK
jgi:hypothetical protein